MYTKESICKAIHEIAECPMTLPRTETLAFLLYIKEHCYGLHEKSETDKSELLEWVDHMENADGTTGPHLSWNDAAPIKQKYGIPCENLDFYVALNMMYSDYCTAAEKAGASTVELYARMAEAFLKDKDAQPDKLERYYRYIAKHE